jgi:hypothetical protein
VSLEALRGQLTAISDQHGGLTPALVVSEARDPEHPLHARFEWDNELAGEEWRREQARDLIRSVRVVWREATETEQERSVRAFHSVKTPDGHVYRPVEEVTQDPFQLKILMKDMEREWRQLQRRYADFEQFTAMVRRDIEAA